MPAILSELRKRDAGAVQVFCGGIIPDEDVAKLKAEGVAEIFTPGTSTQDIVAWVKAHLKPAQ